MLVQGIISYIYNVVHIVTFQVTEALYSSFTCVHACRCNGKVTVDICVQKDFRKRKEVEILQMSGMNGAAMDYAIHGHAVAHVPMGRSVMQCIVSHRENESLLLHLPHGKRLSIAQNSVYVHFEINHKYFDGLHKAIDSVSTDAIRKLLPSRSLLPSCTTGNHKLGRTETKAIKHFTLDTEYQMNALERMISSDPRVPFLVLGPFGTGKTHILAAAASALLSNRENHILVCTHQHQCANSIYNILVAQKYATDPNAVMRLVPNEQTARFIEGDGVVLMKDFKISDVFQKRVVITTFLTATNIKQSMDQSSQSLIFSHILIDEGAQTREPEALGALAVVKKETKIVIVGDNRQVRKIHLSKHGSFNVHTGW